MKKLPVARGQATICRLQDSYNIIQTVSNYIFVSNTNGVITNAVSFTSSVKIMLADTNFTDFTIGSITSPIGFTAITVDNITKSITYSVAANTGNLSDNGYLVIPILIQGVVYPISFSWSKSKAGQNGANGIDANMLDWVKDWNSNKTVIGADSVITPKIFAGTKHSDGTLTGTAIGCFNLSTLDASGAITTEKIDGVYGFKGGYKTFSLNNTGSVQLGRGNQFIQYNAVTGRIEFGSDVTLNWVNVINAAKSDAIATAAIDATNKTNAVKTNLQSSIAEVEKVSTDAKNVADAITGKANGESWSKKLTYIGSTGIFTGTLSANTVTAIGINASQITAGTITAARIDVAALKTSLITAGNIESLTLNVTKGKVGGWSLDADSIYRGTKNNSAGAQTATSGAICIGSNGIRGFKWRLDATGAGALAGGNIAWDAAGNVTFGSSVVLNWTAPINKITTALGGTSFSKMTYISDAGIYTGSITAVQVNAVAIDASSITAGTLSANRIASRTLTAAKIAAGTITAAEINVSNVQASVVTATAINGLSCTFVKGSIGGWGINSTQISKNNVCLSADGSICNSTKWCLNNDGSGQIAGGNISWNAAGVVAFSSSVSLNWVNAVNNLEIGGINLLNNSGDWRSAGWNGGYTSNGGGYTIDSSVLFKGKPALKTDVGTGLTHSAWVKLETNVDYTYSAMVKCNKTITGNGNTPLHYWAGKDNASQSKISVVSYDTSVVADTWKRIFVVFRLTSDGDSFRPFFYRGSNESTFYHIAYIKLERGNKPTDWCQSVSDANKLSGDAQNSANLITTALGGAAFPKLTQITSTGIYTGTLTATQINAVAINASSITTGVLSAERITAGSIHASKLNAASLKADIINVSYINGLACTFTKGTIGGWTISAGSISKGELILDYTNKRIAVYGSSSSSTSGQRVQIYHNNNADFGIFATDTAGASVFQLGSSNKIAGWTISSSQIYKNNIYLGADGSIYNGMKWRLHNDGSGRLANGNISWDATGSVTFGSSVSLNWTNAATNALNSAKNYADTKKTEAINAAASDATTKANAAKELANAMAFGKMLYRDPEFRNGINGTYVYNNSGNGTVSVTRTGLSSSPNDSKIVLEIRTAGSATPGNGGFCFQTMCSNRKVFITRIIAKIPAGRNLQWATNSIGIGGAGKWLTPNAGTGDWQEYILKVACGTSNFSSTNFFYIDGTQGTSASPLVWHVAFATVFDTTAMEKYTTTINSDGIYTGSIGAGQIKVDTSLIVGGSSYNGSISVRNSADIVMATLDRAGVTAVAGTIGGWTISNNSIYAFNPSNGHRIYLTNSGYLYNNDGSKDYWGLRPDGSATFGYGNISFGNDGSGFVAGGNISWDARGNVNMTGRVTANSGLIAGFTISGNKLVNTAADSSIEFSSLIGNASLTINSYSALLSLRADSARTGIYLQTYATGAKGIYIIANAGSKYAIESYGPMQLGQRSGERWNVPGVLYVGCKYNGGNNASYRKIWGDGLTITSCSFAGDGKYRFYHNLGHTDYTVFAQVWQSTGYYGFFRLLERASNSFLIQNLGNNGKPDGAPFDFTVMGRNCFS